MTKHTKKYRWGYKLSALSIPTHTGNVDLSGGHDWSVNNEDFKLNGTTITLNSNCADLTAVVNEIATEISNAGLSGFTVGSSGNFVTITYGNPFSLEAGSSDALATLGWTADVYNDAALVACDSEMESVELPSFRYNKERVWLADGSVINPPKEREDYNGNFPMFVQQSTFIEKMITDIENVGGSPTLFSLIWSNGDFQILSDYNAWIGQLDIAFSSEFVKQTVLFNHKSIEKVDAVGDDDNIPDRDTSTSPITRNDVTVLLDASSLDDLEDFTLSLKNGLEPQQRADSWDKTTPIVLKKDIELNMKFLDTTPDSDEIFTTSTTEHSISVQLGSLGTISMTKMRLVEKKVNEVGNEPKLYEYNCKYVNGNGTVISWS